ncbi:MAG: dephospho-CoA kinase [Crocinitomicaceae bacterium]|jgi:dephospho-CoA kinase|nr:dephospho-CoA kinase [Crocinitomicaceae bacterium]
MLLIGITGGIGSGKSLVAKILETLKYPVFYSDSEAKNIVRSNDEVQNEIIRIFGPEAYLQGEYNRPFVAEKVFANQELLTQLNQLIHPAVRAAFDEFCDKSKAEIVFNEAAILFETGTYKSFDAVILVCSPEKLRVERLMKRDNASKEEIQARMNKQWSDDKKKKLTNLIIENDEKSSILEQIHEILTIIRPR